MQLHDTALTIAGGVLLSVCLVAGGIATVAGDLGSEASVEVLELTGVTGEGAAGGSKDAGASAKDSKAIPAETSTPATEEPAEEPVDAAPQQPTEVPPAAPVAPRPAAQQQTAPKPGKEHGDHLGTTNRDGDYYQHDSGTTYDRGDGDGDGDGDDRDRHRGGGGLRSGGGHR